MEEEFDSFPRSGWTLLFPRISLCFEPFRWFPETTLPIIPQWVVSTEHGKTPKTRWAEVDMLATHPPATQSRCDGNSNSQLDPEHHPFSVAHHGPWFLACHHDPQDWGFTPLQKIWDFGWWNRWFMAFTPVISQHLKQKSISAHVKLLIASHLGLFGSGLSQSRASKFMPFWGLPVSQCFWTAPNWIWFHNNPMISEKSPSLHLSHRTYSFFFITSLDCPRRIIFLDGKWFP